MTKNQHKMTLPKLLFIWTVFGVISVGTNWMTMLDLNFNLHDKLFIWSTYVYAVSIFVISPGLYIYFKDANKSKQFMTNFKNHRDTFFITTAPLYAIAILLSLFGNF